MAGSLSGKWPRLLVILLSWKLMDSMALVVCTVEHSPRGRDPTGGGAVELTLPLS